MAEEFYGKGIGVASGFDLSAKSPLDTRTVVDTIEQRDAHVAGNRAYPGLKVYVTADKKEYIYDGSTWKVNGGNSLGVNVNTDTETLSYNMDFSNTDGITIDKNLKDPNKAADAQKTGEAIKAVDEKITSETTRATEALTTHNTAVDAHQDIRDDITALETNKLKKAGWGHDKYLTTDSAGNVVESVAPDNLEVNVADGNMTFNKTHNNSNAITIAKNLTTPDAAAESAAVGKITGSLETLTTDDKTSLVNAINEVKAKPSVKFTDPANDGNIVIELG